MRIRNPLYERMESMKNERMESMKTDFSKMTPQQIKEYINNRPRPIRRYDFSHPPKNIYIVPRNPVYDNIDKHIDEVLKAKKDSLKPKLQAYKKGGRVKRTGKALVHKGEYILPRGVKPTKAQVKKIAAMKKRK